MRVGNTKSRLSIGSFENQDNEVVWVWLSSSIRKESELDQRSNSSSPKFAKIMSWGLKTRGWNVSSKFGRLIEEIRSGKSPRYSEPY